MNKGEPNSDEAPQDAGAGETAGAAVSPAADEAIAHLIAEIDSLREELEQNNARIHDLERLADRDPLVPLANRRAFMRELERFNDLAERYGTPSSVIYLDVDGMKRVNDDFGHAAGDSILIAVAETLLANIRASDVAGRLGGDEFGVILAHMNEEMAGGKAGSLADIIASTRVEHAGTAIPVSVSWGVFTFTGETDISAALEAADKAMYARKRAGK